MCRVVQWCLSNSFPIVTYLSFHFMYFLFLVQRPLFLRPANIKKYYDSKFISFFLLQHFVYINIILIYCVNQFFLLLFCCFVLFCILLYIYKTLFLYVLYLNKNIFLFNLLLILNNLHNVYFFVIILISSSVFFCLFFFIFALAS